MRTGLTFAASAVFSLALLSGCNKDRSEVAGERDTYDDIGETRVFDDPHRVASRRSRTNGTASESVPAPAPLVESSRNTKELAKKVEKAAKKSRRDVAAAPKHRPLIGELDMDK